MPKSAYVLVVDGLSSATRSKDIKYEFEKRFGPVLEVERDVKARLALVEFKSSYDAERAWRRMDGFSIDGRSWKVDYATPEDFRFFGWKWTEGGNSKKDDRSPSRSRSRSRSKSPAASNSRDDEADIAP